MNAFRLKTILISMIALIFLSAEVDSQIKKAGPFTQFENRLQWEDEGELYWIDAYGADALRFRSTKSLRIADQDWNLLPQPGAKLEISIAEDKAVVKNGGIRAEIESRRGQIGRAHV